MSPRWFVGLVGTALIALSIGLWMGYDMTATSSGHTVACGTLQHPINPGFGEAYRWVLRGDGEPNDYNAACDDKREPFKLAAYALGGIGVLTTLGAVAIRARRADMAQA